jgi:SAM-dependent methyltransferase
MRYAEFEGILRELDLRPGQRVLDVSSPQWFAVYLADANPNVDIVYTNLLEEEVAPFREIASALGLRNLTYHRGDVCSLDFPDGAFDRAVSISVIEHVYPEVGGDVRALREIRRVLKDDGRLVLTVPFKAERNILYIDGAVYGREGTTRSFFAREYDAPMFEALVAESGLTLASLWYVCESAGGFAPDFHEWGPGKGSLWAKLLYTSRRAGERILRVSLDELLARRYLHVSRVINHRVVNAAAVLSAG